jgi:hypothetical protein
MDFAIAAVLLVVLLATLAKSFVVIGAVICGARRRVGREEKP